MGSLDLSSPADPATERFWSSLPIAPDPRVAQNILGTLTNRVAEVRGVPVPRSFRDAPTSAEWAASCDSIPDVSCTPDLLGATLEVLLSPAERRSKGAHFTPPHVADIVVGIAVGELDLRSHSTPPSVWDPASGGGAFLLAAARRLDGIGSWTRSEIVSRMYASDIDPVALAVSKAALSLWSGSEAEPFSLCGDTLLEACPTTWPTSFDLVVGNPPFLSQLRSETSRDRSRRKELREVFEAVAGGYVDDSGLFLVATLSRLGPDGVAALVLPDSILAARDSRSVREEADRLAELRALWIDPWQSFEAAVDVVAPVFAKPRGSEHRRRTPGHTMVTLGLSPPARLVKPDPSTWSPLLAGARGVPVVATSSDERLDSLATVTAGFRQHFYGLSGAVREAEEIAGPRQLRLVTSGAIEPLRLLWGRQPVKFAGSRWMAPVVDLEAIEDAAVRMWFDARTIPKLLVATQTRVLEVVVDTAGQLLPSVPVLSLEPHDPADLWLLAAVVSSPFASAWTATRSAGSGMSQNTFRIRSQELGGLPLPEDRDAWLAGARSAEQVHEASTTGDDGAYVASMRRLAHFMSLAYRGATHESTLWWWGRLRMPEGFAAEAY